MRWKIAQWFEQRWWKSYLADKNLQDYLDWKSFIAELHLQHPNRRGILDTGCRQAGIFTVLSDNEFLATDPLLNQYAQQLQHSNKADYPWINFEQKTIEEINFNETFDLVFCLNVINHVKNLDRYYDNLISAAKTGGKLIFSVDSHNFTVPKLLFRLLPLDIIYPRQYELNEYQRHFTERDLKILRSTKIKSSFLFDYYAL